MCPQRSSLRSAMRLHVAMTVTVFPRRPGWFCAGGDIEPQPLGLFVEAPDNPDKRRSRKLDQIR